MKVKLILVLALSIASALGVVAEPRVAGVTAEETKAIVALGKASDVAWDSKDVDAMAACFTADGHNVILGASVVDLRGHAAMKEFFRAAFGRRQGTFRHVTTVDEIQKIADGIAVADSHVAVEKLGDDGKWTEVRRFSGTSVVVRDAMGWKIRLNRVRPETMPQPAS